MHRAKIYCMLWAIALACWIPRLAEAQQAPAGDDLMARLAALEGQIAALRSQGDTQQKALTELQTALVAAQKQINFLQVTLLSPTPGATARSHRSGGSGSRGGGGGKHY